MSCNLIKKLIFKKHLFMKTLHHTLITSIYKFTPVATASAYFILLTHFIHLIKFLHNNTVNMIVTVPSTGCRIIVTVPSSASRIPTTIASQYTIPTVVCNNSASVIRHPVVPQLHSPPRRYHSF